MNAKTYDPFTPGLHLETAPLHNVTLLSVTKETQLDGAAGSPAWASITVDYQGRKVDLPSGRWSEYLGQQVSMIGSLHFTWGLNGGLHERKSWHFRPYLDQRLRRAPELDHQSLKGWVLGWTCEAEGDESAGRRPPPIYAPPHIVPGVEGQFVHDETVELTLRVPPEFLRECRRVQMKPEDVLRGFIADVSDISNYVNRPRADGYSSNGSDEREMASAWLDRAFGANAVDIDELEGEDEVREERRIQGEDLAGLLDDFVDYGGNPETLLNTVSQLVDQQRAVSEG